MPRCRFVLVLGLLAWARPAAAYRPFDGTDAAVAGRGELELELGTLGYWHARGSTYLAPVQVINYGLVKRVELVLAGRPVVPAYRAESARFALDETEVSVKSVLREGALQDAPGPSVALELGTLLPTLHGEPGAGAWAAVIVSERLRFATLHLNVEGARTRAKNADFVLDVIAEGRPLLAGARPVAELSFEREFTADSTLGVLVGFIAEVSERFDLDAATRFARSGHDRLFEIRGGFTWALELVPE